MKVSFTENVTVFIRFFTQYFPTIGKIIEKREKRALKVPSVQDLRSTEMLDENIGKS